MYEAVTRGIRVRVTPQYLEEESAPDERRYPVVLHHRDQQRGQPGRAAALAALAYYRCRRPHRGGARPRRRRPDPDHRSRAHVPLHVGVPAEDAIGIMVGSYQMTTDGGELFNVSVRPSRWTAARQAAA